ncbi:MAG TPA: hypothetical protein VMV20_03310 [Chitinophagaceae bacterium]|nr:hypothetical protein [Chitinophagaceae bacterium]
MFSNQKFLYKTRLTGLLLLTAGYGWAGGHFIPAGITYLAYLIQLAIILILLVFTVAYLNLPNAPSLRGLRGGWPVIALTVFTVLSLILNIANVIQGVNNHSPDAFGSHNTPADLFPIVLIMIGNVLWISTLFSRAAPSPSSPGQELRTSL